MGGITERRRKVTCCISSPICVYKGKVFLWRPPPRGQSPGRKKDGSWQLWNFYSLFPCISISIKSEFIHILPENNALVISHKFQKKIQSTSKVCLFHHQNTPWICSLLSISMATTVCAWTTAVATSPPHCPQPQSIPCTAAKVNENKHISDHIPLPNTL